MGIIYEVSETAPEAMGAETNVRLVECYRITGGLEMLHARVRTPEVPNAYCRTLAPHSQYHAPPEFRASCEEGVL